MACRFHEETPPADESARFLGDLEQARPEHAPVVRRYCIMTVAMPSILLTAVAFRACWTSEVCSQHASVGKAASFVERDLVVATAVGKDQHWDRMRDPSGRIFYYNPITEDSTWSRPDSLVQAAGSSPEPAPMDEPDTVPVDQISSEAWQPPASIPSTSTLGAWQPATSVPSMPAFEAWQPPTSVPSPPTLEATTFTTTIVTTRMTWAPPQNKRLVANTALASSSRSTPTCESKEACLSIVDRFLDGQPRQDIPTAGAGLIRIMSVNSLGGGPCGELCDLPEGDGRFDTYDNALAAIYWTKRGHLQKAAQILDVFIRLMYPTDVTGIRSNVLYTNLPSGRTLTLLAASYSSKAQATAGDYFGEGVIDGAVDTGNNAWAGLAFVHYAASTNSACHAAAARDILYALSRNGCGDALQGFLGRLPPFSLNYRSIEHNIDVVALARSLGEADIEAWASRFVSSMRSRNAAYPSSYSMGTGRKVYCDASQPEDPVPADGTFWNVLADADPNSDGLASALRFALQSPAPGTEGADDMQGLWEQDVDLVYDGGSHPVLTGTRFTTGGNGVQWENSAGAAMALLHFQNRYGSDMGLQLQERARQVMDSLRHLLAMYGGVPASVLGGNMEAFKVKNHTAPYPGGSDTGISYTYLRYNHVASTAWTGLLLLYQANPSETINEAANPFATKATSVPEPNDFSCLPVTPRRAPTTPQAPPMLVPAVAPEARTAAATKASTMEASLTRPELEVLPEPDQEYEQPAVVPSLSPQSAMGSGARL